MWRCGLETRLEIHFQKKSWSTPPRACRATSARSACTSWTPCRAPPPARCSASSCGRCQPDKNSGTEPESGARRDPARGLEDFLQCYLVFLSGKLFRSIPRLAGVRTVLAVEARVRQVQLFLPLGKNLVEQTEQLARLVDESIAHLLVDALGVLDAAAPGGLEAPVVIAPGARRHLGAERVVADREHVVDIALVDLHRDLVRGADALHALVADHEVEAFLLEHRAHAAREGREGGLPEHGELILADAVAPVVPGEDVYPVELHVEHLEQRLAARRAPLEQLARRSATLAAEVRDEEVGHLPAVARLLRHVPREPLAVVLG